MNKADSRANVFVKASGVNNFPSWACKANTGIKLITVVARAVITAGATSMVQAKEAALMGILEEDELLEWAKNNDKHELFKAMNHQTDGYSR